MVGNDNLNLESVTKRFGGLIAVKDVTLSVGPGELVGLIGPNGAGKTTIFNLITGVYRPDGGKIRWSGRDIAGFPSHQVAALGIVRTFQNIRLFPHLSVLDNVKIACHLHSRESVVAAVLRTGAALRQESEITDRAALLLTTLGIDNTQATASSLPYGDQRRLEIARALATGPRLLLLDEPAAGMNPHETGDLMELIQRVRHEFGLSILLIEHDMKVVMGICERLTVLDYGQVIATGPPEQIRSDPQVIAAYLGQPL